MKPITLAFKDYKVNPFTGRGNGELMIVHQCLRCGKLSPNRIAGDDNEYQIISILKESCGLKEGIINRLQNLGLELIPMENREEILISLFGVNYRSCIKNIDDFFN